MPRLRQTMPIPGRRSDLAPSPTTLPPHQAARALLQGAAVAMALRMTVPSAIMAPRHGHMLCRPRTRTR